MSFWSETWTGNNGSPWPAGWSTAGTLGGSSATIESDRGRLAAGPGGYAAARGRLDRMDPQRDTNVVVSFVPRVGGEWYLALGVRTQSNDPPSTSSAVSSRGMYATINNLFGQSATFTRWDDSGTSATVGHASTGLPVFLLDTVYTARFRIEGRRLRLRVWAAANPEPDTWALDVTDPDAYLEPGKLLISFTTNAAGAVGYIDVDDLAVAGLDPVLPEPAVPDPAPVWTMWSRAADYSPDVVLPIVSAKGVRRWLGVGTAVVETVYTPERWLSLQPSRGVVLYRGARQHFTGLVVRRRQVWDADSGQLLIRVNVASDEQHLADRLVFPDPLRAADDQTVNDYWTFTGFASSAMLRLISDQAGPTCHPDRRVAGLVLGTDPGVGLSRTWTGLFSAAGEAGVLDLLRGISVSSGEDLGVRAATQPGSLTYDIVQPRDLADEIRFSVDLGNLVGYDYAEDAPTCTDALSHGQGDLHLRLRKHVRTTSALALAWARQIWKDIDRRDTADVAELTKASTDAVTEGDAKVSLAVTLTDSQAATYEDDWDLGDRITIYVAAPGQDTSITVADVVREVLFEVNDKGVEKITPAVGTHEATALPTSPSQQRLADIGQGLAGLKSWK